MGHGSCQVDRLGIPAINVCDFHFPISFAYKDKILPTFIFP